MSDARRHEVNVPTSSSQLQQGPFPLHPGFDLYSSVGLTTLVGKGEPEERTNVSDTNRDPEVYIMNPDRPIAPDPYTYMPEVPSFTLSSDDVRDNAAMPAAHAKAGDNLSPHLRWEGAPEDTKSYVITCFDPDAPSPSGFWHWVLVDLPRDTAELPTGAGKEDGTALPAGAFHCRGDHGARAYSGAAPPPGDRAHRYYFVAHAVDQEKLGVDENASPAKVSVSLAFHTLGRAMLVPTYQT